MFFFSFYTRRMTSTYCNNIEAPCEVSFFDIYNFLVNWLLPIQSSAFSPPEVNIT